MLRGSQSVGGWVCALRIQMMVSVPKRTGCRLDVALSRLLKHLLSHLCVKIVLLHL